jgi:prephenate dehydratase
VRRPPLRRGNGIRLRGAGVGRRRPGSPACGELAGRSDREELRFDVTPSRPPCRGRATVAHKSLPAGGERGGKRRTLKRVISHPQALAHCQRRLAALGVQVEAVDNAASAARFVAENGIDDTAVIGSEIAGREYGLQVVEEEIQDDSSNTTRFLILSKPNNKNNNSSAHPGSKTTVAFSLKEGTADLFKALSIFAVRDIKVTKIESRPQRENPLRMVMNEEQDGDSSKCYFEYVFFVDLEAPKQMIIRAVWK